MRDQKFVSGEFFDVRLPAEEKYLMKYFTTDIQSIFLKYMHVFGDYSLFREHTGFQCTNRILQILRLRLKNIKSVHDDAKKNMDFETLALIERGEYKIPS